jgi:hypothetical protein
MQPFTLDAQPVKYKKRNAPTSPPPKQKKEKKHSKEFERRAAFLAGSTQAATTAETDFRHSAWATKRAAVRRALIQTATTARAIERFDECGADAVVEWCEETKRYRIRANHCHCRHCEPCQRAKAALLAANLRTKIELAPSGKYRFVTLTLKHTDDQLANQIKRLYRSFTKLRHTTTWKETQEGGAAILEIKWSPDSRQWHPHLHVICEGRYLRQMELADAWHTVTGDSSIVDIRALKSGRDAAHYLSKYVAKGTNTEVWADDSAAQEWVTATKGVRACATFGSWRGFRLLARPDSDETWVRVDSLQNLHTRAIQGDDYAITLLIHLQGSITTANPRRGQRKHKVLIE